MDEEKQPEEQPTPQTEEHFPFFQNCSKTFQFTQVNHYSCKHGHYSSGNLT